MLRTIASLILLSNVMLAQNHQVAFTPSSATVEVQVTGTFEGTVSFMATKDGHNWHPINACDPAQQCMTVLRNHAATLHIQLGTDYMLRADVNVTSGQPNVIFNNTTN